MKNILLKITTVVLLLASCSSEKEITQEDFNSWFKNIANENSTHTANFKPTGERIYIDNIDFISIKPIQLKSETEILVKATHQFIQKFAKNKTGTATATYTFNKSADGKWYVTNYEEENADVHKFPNASFNSHRIHFDYCKMIMSKYDEVAV